MVEDSGFLSNHNCTSTSLGSRINCTNSSSSQIAKSPVHNSLRKNYQSSGGISGISGNLSGNLSGNSYQKSISTSPITVTTMSDGRVERRLETCSYQETEMWFRRASCVLPEEIVKISSKARLHCPSDLSFIVKQKYVYRYYVKPMAEPNNLEFLAWGFQQIVFHFFIKVS